MSLMEFMRDWPDDAACLDWLWRERWSEDGTHADCPKCERKGVAFKRYKTAQRRQSWTCTGCGHHVHPTAGTIFHKSSTSLRLWFYAFYLMTSTRCGISAKHLERELGVNYKTAWRMLNKIRNELMTDDGEVLNGPIEADETYVGGRRRHGASGRPGADSHKTPVFGLAQRGRGTGQVYARVVPDATTPTLMGEIKQRVMPAALVYTDEWKPYENLPKAGYSHRRIHHRSKVYVSGDVHTNTIEGFFALVKSGIRGTYHSVSRNWLQGYLNEYAWRYNHRSDERAQFGSLLLRAAR